MKEQFLNLTGLTELVGYLKTSIANHKEILPYDSNKLFPSVGDINTIYINTATNTIYRWDSSSKTYITLAKAVKSVAISESTENGKITLTVDGNKTTVPVHGLGSAAYTNSSAYSSAGHTHTKAQVGLGNVDNTADANKSVKHATTADSATTAGTATNVSAGEGTADAARHVWFSDSTTETKRAYSDKFKYNPVTNNLTVNVTGNAATASSVAWGNITEKPSTYAPSAHNHNDSTITSLNASKLFGTIDIARLPHGALERLIIVEDDTARFKLTTANIQLGDTVKVTKTEKMYYVVDESKLSSEAGYSVYTAGTATSVPWSGVTEKPSSYPPASHNHDERYYTETEMNSKLAEKATKVHTHTKSEVGLGNVDNTADATKSVKYAISAGSASSAAALTSNAGSSTQPVYFSGGKPIACSYTLGKSVPADALFTDHTYGNMKGATSSSAGSAGLVPAPNIGEQLKFLRADGTWVIPTNTTYSVGTTSYLGITKLYTETGSATDGTMTQNAITTALNGKSPTSHTHNYAGSSSSGGAADSAIKLNTSRNITIGNSTKSFDGTTNLSWSLNEIGIPTKSDIAACAVMYGGTTLSSSATVTDSAAQYKVISRSTGSTGDIFTKSVTLPKGLYSVMIRMKVSTISSSSNVFKLTIIDGSTTTTKYIKPNMFKAEDSYTTLGTAVENTSGTLKITLNVYSALSNQTVCVDYLAIAPTMVGVTSIA